MVQATCGALCPICWGNFVAGEEFLDLANAQTRAEKWCRKTAGQRIHSTTPARPIELFAEHEAAALLAVPGPYDVPIFTRIKVHRDCHIEVGSFYKTTASFREPTEVDALLAAPDLTLWEGQRDRALLALAAQTDLRLSEPTGTNRGDIQFGTGAHLRCSGKGPQVALRCADNLRRGRPSRLNPGARRSP